MHRSPSTRPSFWAAIPWSSLSRGRSSRPVDSATCPMGRGGASGLAVLGPILVTALAMVSMVLPARADERGTARRHSPIQLRGSSTYQPPAGIPRHLTPPAGSGSAANVGSGFYRQLDAPHASPGAVHGQGPGGQSGVVYVIPGGLLPYAVVTNPYTVGPVTVGVDPVAEPRRRGEASEASEPRAEPSDQRPVVIINNPPAEPRGRPSPTSSAQRLPPRRPVLPPTPRPTAPMNVEFSISPRDAEVWLDDDLLGNGEQLAGLDEPMRLDPGVYVVEVTHPGHPPQRIVFGVGSKPIEVLVDLEATTPRRRSRVRQ